MKLRDAIFKMNPGDKFDVPELDELTPYTMQSSGMLYSRRGSEGVKISPNNLNLEGEIIRADPEVLTADESWIKYLGHSTLTSDDHKIRYKSGFNNGVPNGQLKEWKRLKPLIDKVKEIMLNYPSEFTEDSHKAIQNLTPPWEPEK